MPLIEKSIQHSLHKKSVFNGVLEWSDLQTEKKLPQSLDRKVKAIGLVKTASKLKQKGESYRASKNCLEA
mgnify:CR=1 FL=1